MRSSFFWILLVILGMIYVIGFGIALILIGANRSDSVLIFAGVLLVTAGVLGVAFRGQIVRACGNGFQRYIANLQQWQQARRHRSTKWYLWDFVEMLFALLTGVTFIMPMFLGRLDLVLIGMVMWFLSLSVLEGVRALATQLAWKGYMLGTFQIVRGAEAKRQGVIRIVVGIVGLILCGVAAVLLLNLAARP